MKVLIQSKNGAPYNISATIAAHGFRQRGYELGAFTVEEIETAPFDRRDVVVGGVGTYTRVFRRLGMMWEGVTYPESLTGFLGRDIDRIKLSQLEPLVEERPRFIKPAADNKAFTGFVCKDRWAPRLAPLANDFELICADVVSFVSEYRVYVLDGKIQNISRYHGSANKFPNVRMVREMIACYERAPIAYGLDVGVDDHDKTLLVEVNEGLALGNYGLAPVLHAKMIAARWHQLAGDMVAAHEAAQTVDSPSFVNEL